MLDHSKHYSTLFYKVMVAWKAAFTSLYLYTFPRLIYLIKALGLEPFVL